MYIFNQELGLSKIKKRDVSEYYEMSIQNLNNYRLGNFKKQRRYDYLLLGFFTKLIEVTYSDIQKWVCITNMVKCENPIISDQKLAKTLHMSLQNLNKTYKNKGANTGKRRMYIAFRVGALCEMYGISHLEIQVIAEKKKKGFFLKTMAK